MAGPPVNCPLTARGDCRTAQKSLFGIKNKTDDSRDRFLWKWIKGQPTAVEDFGDPTTTTAYKLCLYAGVDEHLISDGEIVVPPGQGWTAVGTRGLKYRDKTPSAPDGIQKVLLRAHSGGKAQVKIKGRGLNLPDPVLPIPETDFPFVVQLVNDAPAQACWESRFQTTQILRNKATQLKLKAP